MKRNIIICVTAWAWLITACKDIEIPSPALDVTVEKLEYHVNDTIKFNISGDANNIMFYSGEEGRRYEKAGMITVQRGTPQLDFRTIFGGGTRPNSLKVLVTADNTIPSAANLSTINWIDITSRAVLASATTATLSGVIDLSDIAAEDKPIRLAYKYEAAMSTTLAQPIWVINILNINTIYPDGSMVPIVTLPTTQWTAFDIKNPAAQWTIAAAQLRLDGGPRNSPDNEDWVVSNPIDLKARKEVVDLGVSLKNLGSSTINQYLYNYKKEGVYNVTFVGFNNTIDQEKSVVKQFEITIKP